MPTITCKSCEQKSALCEHLAQSFVAAAQRAQDLHRLASDLIAWGKASGMAAGAVIEAEQRLAKIGGAAVARTTAPGGEG